MYRKYVPLILSLVLIVLFCSQAWALVEGAWDVEGKTTAKVTIKGYGTEKETTYFEDEFVFYDDGTFEMIDMEGSWSQKARKFTVLLDPDDMESYFEEALGEMLGADVDIDIVSLSFTGSENKQSTRITGKIKMKMYLYVYDYDLQGTITVNTTFKGYRAYESAVSRESRDSDRSTASMLDSTAETIENYLQTP